MIRFSGPDPWGDLTDKQQRQVNWHRVEVRGLPPLRRCADCDGAGWLHAPAQPVRRCPECQGDGAIEQQEAP